MSRHPEIQTYGTLYAVSMVFFAAMIGLAGAPLANVAIDRSLTAVRMASLEAFVLAFLAMPLLLYYVGLRALQRDYSSAAIFYAAYFILHWIIFVTGGAWGLKVNAIFVAGLGIGPWMLLLGWISRHDQHG